MEYLILIGLIVGGSLLIGAALWPSGQPQQRSEQDFNFGLDTVRAPLADDQPAALDERTDAPPAEPVAAGRYMTTEPAAGQPDWLTPADPKGSDAPVARP